MCADTSRGVAVVVSPPHLCLHMGTNCVCFVCVCVCVFSSPPPFFCTLDALIFNAYDVFFLPLVLPWVLPPPPPPPVAVVKEVLTNQYQRSGNHSTCLHLMLL